MSLSPLSILERGWGEVLTTITRLSHPSPYLLKVGRGAGVRSFIKNAIQQNRFLHRHFSRYRKYDW